ncbi:hypothetical protein CANCADRAFT_82375 [Tortispora caseinolytica NRRL Y-17796]|uniref:HSF-type DNA-binding domain-containing protein n=1 Tax=Tortispora caseinolytica NRRL Y-17796 TaxID=767744 RepID=A0A1E4TK23_9ASCO|nr:hypothetical protein CANCADRAFT_82375 [Tortispora caseinolytica NRRL Y-17796]
MSDPVQQSPTQRPSSPTPATIPNSDRAGSKGNVHSDLHGAISPDQNSGLSSFASHTKTHSASHPKNISSSTAENDAYSRKQQTSESSSFIQYTSSNTPRPVPLSPHSSNVMPHVTNARALSPSEGLSPTSAGPEYYHPSSSSSITDPSTSFLPRSVPSQKLLSPLSPHSRPSLDEHGHASKRARWDSAYTPQEYGREIPKSNPEPTVAPKNPPDLDTHDSNVLSNSTDSKDNENEQLNFQGNDSEDNSTKNGKESNGSVAEVKINQSAFIHKLYTMLEDPSIQHLISWSPKNDSFFVTPTEEFSKILSSYFKHTNVSSFVRQLNMYGFHKVNDLFHSSSSESSKWEFKHGIGLFRRGDLESLRGIKRRTSRHTSGSTSSRDHRNSVGPMHIGSVPSSKHGGPTLGNQPQFGQSFRNSTGGITITPHANIVNTGLPERYEPRLSSPNTYHYPGASQIRADAGDPDRHSLSVPAIFLKGQEHHYDEPRQGSSSSTGDDSYPSNPQFAPYQMQFHAQHGHMVPAQHVYPVHPSAQSHPEQQHQQFARQHPSNQAQQQPSNFVFSKELAEAIEYRIASAEQTIWNLHESSFRQQALFDSLYDFSTNLAAHCRDAIELMHRFSQTAVSYLDIIGKNSANMPDNEAIQVVRNDIMSLNMSYNAIHSHLSRIVNDFYSDPVVSGSVSKFSHLSGAQPYHPRNGFQDNHDRNISIAVPPHQPSGPSKSGSISLGHDTGIRTPSTGGLSTSGQSSFASVPANGMNNMASANAALPTSAPVVTIPANENVNRARSSASMSTSDPSSHNSSLSSLTESVSTKLSDRLSVSSAVNAVENGRHRSFPLSSAHRVEQSRRHTYEQTPQSKVPDITVTNHDIASSKPDSGEHLKNDKPHSAELEVSSLLNPTES